MAEKTGKKVFIASMRAGFGHIKAAEAIETALFNLSPETQIKRLDLMDHASAIIKYLYGKSYLDIVKKLPELYAYSYKNYRLTEKFIKPRQFFDRFHLRSFLKELKEFEPDVAVATHFIPAALFAYYREKKKKHYKITVSITDYEIHPLWLVDGVDFYTVATEEMKYAMELQGINPEKILVTGIPIEPKFSSIKAKDGLRKYYDLGKKMAVLVSAGSFGLTPIDKVIEFLLENVGGLDFLVVCGKNKKLQDNLRAIQKSMPDLRYIFGFVDNMDELMGACDILITKPGGITVSEALASGIPMILTDPIPGQEEANANYLVESGVAVKAGSLASMAYKLKNFCDNPEILSHMSQAAQKIAKPHAALDIARLILKQ